MHYYSAHCSEETGDSQEDRQTEVSSGIWQAAATQKQPKAATTTTTREYKTCWKHKYWQHTRMLPQTVKLFRFMNINAHPAKGGGGSSVGSGWWGQRSHHKRAAWEYRTQRRLQLQLQHGAIVVVVVVVLAVIDSRTSLHSKPLASCSCCCSSSAQPVLQLVALFVAVVVGLRFSFALYRIYQLIKIRAFYIWQWKSEKNEYIRIYWCCRFDVAVVVVFCSSCCCCCRTRKWHFIAGLRLRRRRRRHTNYAIFSPQF